MNNYFYLIGTGIEPFDSLTDARKHQRYILKKDSGTVLLFHDNKGYYILKKYLDGRESKVIY